MYRYPPLIWTCLLLIAIGGTTLASEEAMSLFAQGVSELNAGELDAALATFKRVTTLAPDFADAHYHLGLTYYQKTEFKKAIAAFTRTLQLLPRDIDARVKLGMASHKAGGAAADPLTRRGFYQQAVQAYQTALEIRPHNVEGLNNLGLAYQELGRFEDAIAAYQKGLALNPEQPQLRANLATAEFTRKTLRDIKAGTYTMEAYRLWKQGVTAGNRGDTRTALKLWEGAVARSPRYAAAYESLAWTYFNLKRFEDAIRAGTTLQTLRPNPQIAQLIGFATELKAGKYPFETYQLWEGGRRASAAGDLEAAVTLLSEAIATGPEFAAAYNTLAWLYADRLGTHLTEAERLARHALTLDPDAPHIYDTLGWVLYQQGRYAEALNVFEQALQQAPNTAEYLYHSSLAAIRVGHTAQALKYLTQAIALNKRYVQKANAQSEFDAIRFTPAFRALIP